MNSSTGSGISKSNINSSGSCCVRREEMRNGNSSISHVIIIMGTDFLPANKYE